MLQHSKEIGNSKQRQRNIENVNNRREPASRMPETVGMSAAEGLPETAWNPTIAGTPARA